MKNGTVQSIANLCPLLLHRELPRSKIAISRGNESVCVGWLRTTSHFTRSARSREVASTNSWQPLVVFHSSRGGARESVEAYARRERGWRTAINIGHVGTERGKFARRRWFGRHRHPRGWFPGLTDAAPASNGVSHCNQLENRSSVPAARLNWPDCGCSLDVTSAVLYGRGHGTSENQYTPIHKYRDAGRDQDQNWKSHWKFGDCYFRWDLLRC